MATRFEFLVGDRPSQLKGNATRRVKAHLSRQAWKTHAIARHKPGSRRRYNKADQTVTFELVESQTEGVQAVELRVVQQPPLEYQLGGGRVDPFRAYPGEWKPFVPELVDHYLVHMAVDIPELDQPGNKGLLRTRWFPLVISNAATFQTVLLLSASNSASVNRIPRVSCEILQLKSEAIRCINAAFADEQKRVSDAVIGAVAKMASFEAMHGNAASYRVHMDGLCRMVMVRGGLDALGLGGLLRRIIVWIDLNSSFLLGLPRFFPGVAFDEISEPNPERFVAP